MAELLSVFFGMGIPGSYELNLWGVWYLILLCVVICRGAMLGNRYGPGSGTIWLDDVQCEGTESSLDSCQHNGWGDHTHCGHSDDVSIACYGSTLLRSCLL